MKGDHDVEDLIATYGVEPPEDPSTPFIVAQEVALQDDGTHHISLVISSMAILDTILHDDKEKILQLDYTHGLSVDDLLVAMVGTPNTSHEYCPIAISITTAENTKSATEILTWVQRNNVNRTKAVLADGARCLSLAIHNVFGDAVDRIMCFFHMKTNFRKRAESKRRETLL